MKPMPSWTYEYIANMHSSTPSRPQDWDWTKHTHTHPKEERKKETKREYGSWFQFANIDFDVSFNEYVHQACNRSKNIESALHSTLLHRSLRLVAIHQIIVLQRMKIGKKIIFPWYSVTAFEDQSKIITSMCISIRKINKKERKHDTTRHWWNNRILSVNRLIVFSVTVIRSFVRLKRAPLLLKYYTYIMLHLVYYFLAQFGILFFANRQSLSFSLFPCLYLFSVYSCKA